MNTPNSVRDRTSRNDRTGVQKKRELKCIDWVNRQGSESSQMGTIPPFESGCGRELRSRAGRGAHHELQRFVCLSRNVSSGLHCSVHYSFHKQETVLRNLPTKQGMLTQSGPKFVCRNLPVPPWKTHPPTRTTQRK